MFCSYYIKFVILELFYQSPKYFPIKFFWDFIRTFLSVFINKNLLISLYDLAFLKNRNHIYYSSANELGSLLSLSIFFWIYRKDFFFDSLEKSQESHHKQMRMDYFSWTVWTYSLLNIKSVILNLYKRPNIWILVIQSLASSW